MRVLITRPREDAEPLACELRALGHAPLIEPLLDIRVQEDAAVDLSDVQALLFTSANGVRAFARLSPRRDLPVLSVGEASARAAREAGFAAVESAGGDAGDLARLVRGRLDPADGVLFHAAGSVTRGDLKGRLEAAGFAVRRVALYQAVPAAELSMPTRTALAAGAIDAVLFFSPRTARTFARLVSEAAHAAACAGVDAVCLSRAVADEVAALTWRSVCVAVHPERAFLLRALAEAPADGNRGPAATKDAMNQDKTSEQAEDAASETDSQDPRVEASNPAQAVIARFGGIRPMAHKLGVAVSTVQGWKNRGAIPETRHDEILQAARQHGIELDRAVLRASGDETARREAAAAPEPARTSEEEHAAAAEATAAAAAESQREAAAAEHAVGAEAAAASSPGVTAGGGEPPAWSGAAVGGGAMPPPRPGGWIPGMLLGAAILAAGAGAAVVTRDQWLPHIGEGPAVVRPEEARLGNIERRLNAVPALRSNLAELSRQVATIEDRLAQVEARAPTAGAQEVTALRQRLDSLEQAAAGAQEVTALRQRLDSLEQAAAGASRVEALSRDVAALSRDAAALSGRIDTVAQRAGEAADRAVELNGRLEQAVGRLQTAAGRIDQLGGRVEDMGGRVEDVAQSAASSDTARELEQRLSQVEDQVEQLVTLKQRVESQADVKETARAVAARQVAQALAISELRDALRSPAPFTAELGAARRVIPADSELAGSLDALAGSAETGVPTRDQLQARFQVAARRAMAEAAGESGDGWVGGVLRRLNDVVTVRPVGEGAEGAGAGAVLARAEARLAAGDLHGAVQAVESLEGPPGEAMAAWLAQARARLHAEQALSGLSARLTDTLAKAGGDGA